MKIFITKYQRSSICYGKPYRTIIQLLTMKPMKSHLESIKNDIAFCIDELNLDNEMIGELLRICEKN